MPDCIPSDVTGDICAFTLFAWILKDLQDLMNGLDWSVIGD